MKIVLTSNWRAELEMLGIYYIPENQFEKVFNLIRTGYLPVTNCSKTKSNVERGSPKELYISQRNQAFYKWAEHHHLAYGILSDKYALFFHDEEQEMYDTHPSSLSDKDFEQLGKEIKRAMAKRQIKGLIFWNSSPFMSVPYFKMMKCSGEKIFYVTKLLYQTTKKGFL